MVLFYCEHQSHKQCFFLFIKEERRDRSGLLPITAMERQRIARDMMDSRWRMMAKVTEITIKKKVSERL